MFFANPTYLWALLGLLVPIGIHLWSRRQARTLYVGSIDFLEESDSINARTFRPDEWWLLLLRGLIVAAVAVILAGPRIEQTSSRQPIIYVAEASLLQEGLLDTFLDSLDASADIRLLEDGLPAWERDAETLERRSEVPFYWQLVPELNELAADSVVVFTRAYLRGIRSRRPASARHIQWMVVAGETEKVSPMWAWGDAEKATLISLRSGAGETSVEHREILSGEGDFQKIRGTDSISLEWEGEVISIPLAPNRPFRVTIDAPESMGADQRHFEAALMAVSRFLDREVRIQTGKDITDIGSDLHIWLQAGELPEIDGRLLFFGEDSSASELIVPTPAKDQYRLTQRLSPESSLSGQLPERLMELLLSPWQLEKGMKRSDRRQIQASMLTPSGDSASELIKAIDTKAAADLAPWFGLLLLLLFGGERLLALKRRQ